MADNSRSLLLHPEARAMRAARPHARLTWGGNKCSCSCKWCCSSGTICGLARELQHPTSTRPENERWRVTLAKPAPSASLAHKAPKQGALQVLGTCLLILSQATLMSSSCCWNHSPPPPPPPPHRPPHRPPPPRTYGSCLSVSWFSLGLGLSRQHPPTHHLQEP